MKKIGLFFGGLSNEASVSIVSAKNIADNIDNNKYQLVLVYWHKDGNFYIVNSVDETEKFNKSKQITPNNFKNYFDIAFPITHGKYGEDGVLQGVFESCGVKYCGCRVLSSAICMDKSVFKTLMDGQGIKQVKFLTFEIAKKEIIENGKKIYKDILKKIKLPFFIKPANSGSSIGISIAKDFVSFKNAYLEALKHDKKIVVELGLIRPREIEVAIIGNGEDLVVSNPGELIPSDEFYSYDDKYKLNKTKVIIPAGLTQKNRREIIEIAKKAYIASGCNGFARIDLFISSGQVYLNEINTLPGFTSSSMFPMLMMEKGLSYKNLISKIIQLAY